MLEIGKFRVGLDLTAQGLTLSPWGLDPLHPSNLLSALAWTHSQAAWQHGASSSLHRSVGRSSGYTPQPWTEVKLCSFFVLLCWFQE